MTRRRVWYKIQEVAKYWLVKSNYNKTRRSGSVVLKYKYSTKKYRVRYKFFIYFFYSLSRRTSNRIPDIRTSVLRPCHYQKKNHYSSVFNPIDNVDKPRNRAGVTN